MRPAIFVPVLLSVAAPAFARVSPRPSPAAVVVLERNRRGALKPAPCARVDLSDLKAFLSDDTLRAKRCAPKARSLAK